MAEIEWRRQEAHLQDELAKSQEKDQRILELTRTIESLK